MAKFLVLFNAPEPMSQFMNRATAEERQVGLAAWSKWRTEADKTVKFEFGGVVEAVGRVGQAGTGESANQATNYALAEAASKDEVAAALQEHPHLQRPGASIDILQILSMP